MSKNIGDNEYEVSKYRIYFFDFSLSWIGLLILVVLVYASMGFAGVIRALLFCFWSFPLLLMFSIPIFNIIFFQDFPFFYNIVLEYTGMSGDPFTWGFAWFVAIAYAVIGYTMVVTLILSYGYFLGREETRISKIVLKIAPIKKSTIENYRKR